ncbi:hypothetical protein SAMN05421734_101348 [Pelagirhabdus alkalitolerans]|uniref:Uncharacterized protein n=1 Tax=Pelagirhabdus alkalitolerans TaxID=1612202 RepID=A0A1G6GP65_9BACI|nr:hypothetical protein [Pelagirhabdus alkalitolerans]SDB83777.1 hypothetical protein SAMN05421734_101348 [Pelagirhabdus alkalitolerans]
MKKMCVKFLIVSIVLAILTGNVSTSVSADVSNDDNEESVSKQSSDKGDYSVLSEDLMKTADDYIEVKDKQFEITNPQKLKDDIGKEAFEQVKDHVKVSNEQLSNVDENNLTVKNDRILTNTNPDINTVHANTIHTSSIEGRDDFEIYWWGYQVWLSRSTVESILNVGSTAGGTALGGKLGSLPGAVVGAVVGSVLQEFVTPSAARPVWVKYNWVTVTDFGFQ